MNSKNNNDEQICLESVLLGLSKQKLEEFKDVFQKPGLKQFLDDDELTETANQLFKNNLNIANTSKKMFMHRNTLLYRVQKIKKQTGYDVRVFDDAVELKIILTLYKKQK